MRNFHMHPHSFSVVLVLTLALLATGGCATVELESDFRDDGSALHVVETTIEKNALQQLVSLGGGDVSLIFTAQEEAARRAEEAGLAYESIETDSLIGARVSKEVEDASDIGETFDQLFAQATSGGADGSGELAIDGAVSGTFTQDGERSTLNMTIDSDQILSGLGAPGQIPIDQVASFVDITYSASLPGEIVETNGGQIDDNTVLWEIPLTGQTVINATAEGASGDSSILPLIVLLGLLVLLIAAATFFFVIMQRRRVPKSVTTNTNRDDDPPRIVRP